MIVNENSTTETISRKVLKGTVELRATADLITSSFFTFNMESDVY